MNKKKELFLLTLIFILAIFLRFFKLGQNPVSLYWDEAAIGLDAYSINQTGRDMNNMSWLQPVLGSYGDFKAPIMIWLVTISVHFFGMNPFAIRLPVAIFSLLTIYLIYLLVKEVLSFNDTLTKKYKLLPILTAFILSISPWTVHFGRIAFESSISVTFLSLALLFFVKALKNKPFFYLLSTFAGTLAVYSYYSLRVIVPVFCMVLIVLFFKEIKKNKGWLIISIFLFVISVLPIIKSPYYARSQDYRLNNNNIIRHQKIIEESSQYMERYDSNLFSKLVYHRYVLIGRDFLKNIASHFSADFLFISGDTVTLRQHSGYFGEFLLICAPFYYLGLFLLFKNFKTKLSIFLLIFMALSPIPAAMVYEVPHASRAIYLFVPFSILIAWGMNEFILFGKRITVALLVLGFLVNSLFYYSDYFIEYPKRSSQAWLYSYNEVGLYLKDHYKEFSSISIDERYWFPRIFIYYYFPELIGQTRELKNALLNSPINSFGLADPFDYLLDKNVNKKAMFIYFEDPIPDGYQKEKEFNFLNGDKSLILVTK